MGTAIFLMMSWRFPADKEKGSVERHNKLRNEGTWHEKVFIFNDITICLVPLSVKKLFLMILLMLQVERTVISLQRIRALLGVMLSLNQPRDYISRTEH